MKVIGGTQTSYGPCPCEWYLCMCECGWVYNEDEVDTCLGGDDCDICMYCGSETCPECGEHLHCGGCV